MKKSYLVNKTSASQTVIQSRCEQTYKKMPPSQKHNNPHSKRKKRKKEKEKKKRKMRPQNKISQTSKRKRMLLKKWEGGEGKMLYFCESTPHIGTLFRLWIGKCCCYCSDDAPFTLIKKLSHKRENESEG